VTDRKVKLAYWTVLGHVDGIIMDDLCKEFTQENPEIEIESLQGVDDFEAKLMSAVLTGTGPEMTLFRLHYVGPYAARNVIAPFEGGELADAGMTRDVFDPRAWDASFYEGKQFAVPYDIWLIAQFRNKRLMKEGGLDPEKPAQTFDEYYEMAKTLNRGDVIGSGLWTWPPGMFWIYYGLMRQRGGELFLDEGTRCDLTTPAHVEPVRWWHRLRWDINPEAKNGDLVRTGKVALWFDGPWTLSLWSDPERSVITEDYAISLIPQYDPAKPAVFANSHCFALPRPPKSDPEKLRAILRFYRWLAERSFEWSDRAGQVPASSAVRGSDRWQKGTGKILEGSRQFAEALPYTEYFPQHKMFFEVMDRVAAALDAAINTQETTPEQAMQQATEEVNKILAG
jgi:multiple sugar transport system substrate-binding protein